MKRLEKGFTLIELMIVVAIIAILAAVAAPRFGSQIKKAKDAKGLALIGNWRSGSNLYYADETEYATSLGAIAVNNLDQSTQNGTYFVAAGGEVEVGTGEAGTASQKFDGKKVAKFSYSSTEGSITITTNDADTKGTSWSSL